MQLNNRELIKISIVGFLLLFITIYYLDQNYELERTYISKLSLKNINDVVRVEGKIRKQSLMNETLFLEIFDPTGKINGVIFDAKEKFDSDLDYIFEGKVTLYNKNIELIIKEVKIKP